LAFQVYVLASEATGQHYLGQTQDLTARLVQHNDPADRLTLHTKCRRGPWKLIYSEEHPTRAAAMQRERWLKSGVGRDWPKRRLADPNPGC
jgi:putative endonuclease